MKHMIASLAVSSVIGLAAAGSAQASMLGIGVSSAEQILPVQWQNICRERLIIRRTPRGRIEQYQLPLCTEVWVGRRYFCDGQYYADPDFIVPI